MRLSGVRAAEKYLKLSPPMNDRQQAHIDYFLGRVEYWKGLGRDYWAARMLAARDADHAHPLRSEE